MDIYRSEYGITVSAGDEYEAERLTRWECVKAAFALLWNACLPLPKPKPRPAIERRPLSPMGQLILKESMAMLQTNMSFLAKINADYSDKFKAGETIKIRPPTNCS